MPKNSRRGVSFALRLRFVKFLWKLLPALAAGLGDVTDGDAAAAQAALSQVLALGEPTTKALTPKPNLSPAVKPTTAVTKIPTRAVTKTSRKGRK